MQTGFSRFPVCFFNIYRLNYAQRVDSNQKEIVKALRKMGAVVIHTHMLKNAFDILVMYRGKTHLVEIKDGSKSPSQRKLTPGEEKCKSEVESVGVKYNVVESIDQAIELVQKSAEC